MNLNMDKRMFVEKPTSKRPQRMYMYSVMVSRLTAKRAHTAVQLGDENTSTSTARNLRVSDTSYLMVKIDIRSTATN